MSEELVNISGSDGSPIMGTTLRVWKQGTDKGGKKIVGGTLGLTIDGSEPFLITRDDLVDTIDRVWAEKVE